MTKSPEEENKKIFGGGGILRGKKGEILWLERGGKDTDHKGLRGKNIH